MKHIKQQLQDACEEWYLDALSHAKDMEFRHGDRYNEPEFESENRKEFYEMIIESLLKKIDKKIIITKWGVFAEGDEIQIVNPFYTQPKSEYLAKAKLVIEADEWKLSYLDKIYEFDELEIYY